MAYQENNLHDCKSINQTERLRRVFEISAEYLKLFVSRNVRRSRDTSHIPFGAIYHACTSTPMYQSAHEI